MGAESVRMGQHEAHMKAANVALYQCPLASFFSTIPLGIHRGHGVGAEPYGSFLCEGLGEGR